MRSLLFLVACLMIAPLADAQEASLNTPVTRTAEAKYKMLEMRITQPAAYLTVTIQDSGNVEIRQQTYNVPDSVHPSATIAGIFTALDTVRSGETGGQLRVSNFRLLGYLLDNGYLPGVTLVP